MPDSRYYRKLAAKLDEARAKTREYVLQGGPHDYATYREEVGFERALSLVIQMCDEIEKEENQ